MFIDVEIKSGIAEVYQGGELECTMTNLNSGTIVSGEGKPTPLFKVSDGGLLTVDRVLLDDVAFEGTG